MEGSTHGARTVAIGAGIVAGLESPATLDSFGIPSHLAQDVRSLAPYWADLVEAMRDDATIPIPHRLRGPMRPVTPIPGLPMEGADCLTPMQGLVAERLDVLERIESWQRFESYAAQYWLLTHGGAPRRKTIRAESAIRDGILAAMFGLYWARADSTSARRHLGQNLTQMADLWEDSRQRGLQLSHPHTPYPDYSILRGDIRVLTEAAWR